MTEDLARKYAELEARLKEEIALREKAEEQVRELTAALAVRRQCELDLWGLVSFFVETIKEQGGAVTEQDLLRLGTLIENAQNAPEQGRKLTALAKQCVQNMRDNKTEQELRSRAEKQQSQADKIRAQAQKKVASIARQTKRLAAPKAILAALGKKHTDLPGIAGIAAQAFASIDTENTQTHACSSGQHTGRVSVEQLAEAPRSKPEAGEHICPKCSRPMQQVAVINESAIRRLQHSLNDLIENAAYATPVLECACGHYHAVLGKADVPVRPCRTISQGLAIETAHAVTQGKTLNGMEEMLDTSSRQMGSSTLADNVQDWYTDYGADLAAAIEKQAMQADSIVIDETRVRILQQEGVSMKTVMHDGQGKEKCFTTGDEKQAAALAANNFERFGKGSHIVNIVSRPGADKPFLISKLSDARSAEAIAKVLEGYKAQCWTTDGYAAYDTLKSRGPGPQKHQRCLTHFLRLLLQAVPDELVDLAEHKKGKKILETKLCEADTDVLLYAAQTEIRRLYDIENALGRRDDETQEQWYERVRIRRDTESRKHMNALDALMMECVGRLMVQDNKGRRQAKSKDSAQAKALTYYVNMREDLQVFLDEPRVPIDSNCVERSIRPIAVLRAVSHFKQSRDYTRALCGYLTLFGTADACGIEDPVKWLTEYGKARYSYAYDRALARRASQGLPLDKQLHFEAADFAGFDLTAWLPEKYAAAQAAK